MKTTANEIEVKKMNLSSGENQNGVETKKTMKALVYHSRGNKSWEEKAMPAVIKPIGVEFRNQLKL
jgi:hypothetical protein